MSNRSDIIQGIRAWCKAYAIEPSTPLVDAQVIQAYKSTGRPSDDYLAVWLPKHGQKVGFDEKITSRTPGPFGEYYMAGLRKSEAQIHAYGSTAEEWLENLEGSEGDPAAYAILAAAGITVQSTNVIAMPQMKNASLEPHSVLRLDITYRFTGPVRQGVLLEEAQVDYEQSPEGGPSGTLSLDIDVDLP